MSSKVKYDYETKNIAFHMKVSNDSRCSRILLMNVAIVSALMVVTRERNECRNLTELTVWRRRLKCGQIQSIASNRDT